jgi:hypothetical protein
VIDAVVAARIDIVWYRLTDDYLPLFAMPFEKEDCLLYVDYLGQGGEQKEKLSRMIPAHRIIFDHSQAFYQQQYPALANLYSPRKFFGVADGGFLQTQIELPFPEIQDRESLHHFAHLLRSTNTALLPVMPIFSRRSQRLITSRQGKCPH